MHDKKLYGTATVGTKGQVVIPAEVRKLLEIQEGDRLYVVASEKSKFIGFLGEDHLREMVNHLTDNIELYKNVLDGKNKE